MLVSSNSIDIISVAAAVIAVRDAGDMVRLQPKMGFVASVDGLVCRKPTAATSILVAMRLHLAA